MRTIGSVLDENRGIGKGFDFLRIFLAISVLLTHSFLISEGERHQFSGVPFSFLHASILPMFFALSGFLIAGSAMRLKLSDFLLNRGMRIVPALAVDILISALVLGPLLTVVGYAEYFSSRDFAVYFANIIGVIHYTLPGVFEKNPFPNIVNGSLWTIPFEIGCYVLISVFIISGILRRKWVALYVCIVLSALIIGCYVSGISISDAFGIDILNTERVRNLLHHYFSDNGNKLYVYFMAGTLFYLFRHNIPLNKACVSVAVLVCGIAAFVDMSGYFSSALRSIIFAPFVVYITVAIGLLEIPKLPLYGRGDYSYGIYLYGYPLQQALVVVFPSLTSPFIHFIWSLVLVTAVAMLSWHIVEKPILKLRKKFSLTAQKNNGARYLSHQFRMAQFRMAL